MKCEYCSRDTQIRIVQKYQYEDSGLNNVFLDNIEARFCDECELSSPIIPKILRLHNTIGFAIVCKNSPLTGAEIKFLRQNLRVKSQEWARLLRTKKETLSRWESGSQPISAQSDLLIRYLYLRTLEEKKGVRLERKIVEDLSELKDEKTAIVIDVEKIETYSYMPFDEALGLSKIQKSAQTFDLDLSELNIYLSEIEEPLPWDSINVYRIENSARANQELALAA